LRRGRRAARISGVIVTAAVLAVMMRWQIHQAARITLAG